MEFASIRFFVYICIVKIIYMRNKDFLIKDDVLIKYFGNESHVVVPDGVTKIGIRAFFYNIVLTNIEFPNSVTEIDDCAFQYCKNLKNITISNNVTHIGSRAFEWCTNLMNIEIPNSVITIGYCAFNHCTNLKNITIPNSVTNIGDLAFIDCESVTNIQISNNVKRIGWATFSGCKSLKSIEIPNSVTLIDTKAFGDCTNLNCINIPNSVTYIGFCAFSGMKNVKPQYNSNGKLRAFKAFNKDWTCRDFKYEVGKSFKHKGNIECYVSGFHACTNPLSVFNFYYGKLNDLHFAEVELSGEMDFGDSDSRVSASDIKIIREVTVYELAEIYNKM